ncbi:hypothetical protein [Paenibacillus daejeonensis]|uniref:hypothetical protein n=1 Tax=Paenibacillus daejeonensis TaxID=135193 RepID=UPI0012FA7451|nr:hypothetical protein [Paenibacillus daejeonensis]
MNQTKEFSAADLNQWNLISSADIGLKFTNQLSQEEAFSVNAALTSKEREAALQYKDYFPAVLLNQEQDYMILFWERENGNVVYIDIASEIAEDESRLWYVSGPYKEILIN